MSGSNQGSMLLKWSGDCGRDQVLLMALPHVHIHNIICWMLYADEKSAFGDKKKSRLSGPLHNLMGDEDKQK